MSDFYGPLDLAADAIANALTDDAHGLTTPKTVARQINAIMGALNAAGLTITVKEPK